MSYQGKKDNVWEKGKKVRGKDPNLYRKDSENNLMYKHSYGKYSEMGWNIDHSISRNTRRNRSPEQPKPNELKS